MKNIIFQEVGMKNYGPYIDPMILNFETDKLTLITGPNGIGKTMAIDAIPFTLYGTTSKGARGDDVVNNVIGKDCKTWVKFKINDDQFIVTRYHKYTKYNNTVIINQNGVNIKQGHKEVTPLIERIICPQKAFMNAFMFGQKVKDFFTDLQDSQKKEIFRKILDLEMFLTYYKFADSKFKEINSQTSEIDTKIKISYGLLDDTRQQIEALKQSKKDFYLQKEERIKNKNKEIEEALRLLNQWTKTLEELQKEDIGIEETISHLATIESTLKELGKVYGQRFDELSNRKNTKILEIKNAAQKAGSDIKEKYNDLLNELQEKLVDVKQKFSDFSSMTQEEKHKHQIEITKINNTCKSLQERIDEIKNHVLDADISECPLCKQAVTGETIETLNKKIQDYTVSINQLKAKQAEEQTEIKKLETMHEMKRENYESILNNIQSEKNSIQRAKQDEESSLQAKVNSTIEQVNELALKQKKEIENEEETESLELQNQKATLQNKKQQQEENINKINASKDNIKTLENNIKQIERQIKDLEELEYDESQMNSYLKKERDYEISIKNAVEEISSLTEMQDIATFWKAGFSAAGIPSMLIDEAIPFMNQRVDKYLEMLTNGRYIVSFDTLAETKAGEFRDKISVRVLDTHTQANSRVQLSGGQTRIIDIAIILTLGDLLSNIQNMTMNILLFDEIFDALDEQNIQYVSKVLSKLKIGKSIYIISHQHQDHLEADHILTFR
jgi:DNA repair exonuclease SbcCD ATPase subunit